MKSRAIEIMSEDIQHLYAAGIQYRQHASLLEGVFTQLEQELLDHAADDLNQAQWLMDKISFYDEIPPVTVAAIKGAQQCHSSFDLLMMDMMTVIEARARFVAHYEELKAMGGDFAAIALYYMELVDHEESHLNTMKNFLRPYTNTNECSSQEVPDSVDESYYPSIVRLASEMKD